jgi:hypothetical protein
MLSPPYRHFTDGAYITTHFVFSQIDGGGLKLASKESKEAQRLASFWTRALAVGNCAS